MVKRLILTAVPFQLLLILVLYFVCLNNCIVNKNLFDCLSVRFLMTVNGVL